MGLTQILLVGDNVQGIDFLRHALEPHGYDLVVTKSVARGISEVRRRKADLIIVDIIQPTFDGYRVLRSLREIDTETHILMISPSAREDDKVRAFRLGADDYLSKPVGINELVARVEAMLRRRIPSSSRRREPSEPVIRRFGKAEINVSSLQVWYDGQPVSLSPREIDLLLALMEREGRVVTREELRESVWGYERGVVTRTVDNHVAKLRRKLESNPSKPSHIILVRKKGYRFES